MSKVEISKDQLADAEKYFWIYTERLVKHIKQNHSGFPATTCHECLTCQQGIQSNRRIIELGTQTTEDYKV